VTSPSLSVVNIDTHNVNFLWTSFFVIIRTANFAINAIRIDLHKAHEDEIRRAFDAPVDYIIKKPTESRGKFIKTLLTWTKGTLENLHDVNMSNELRITMNHTYERYIATIGPTSATSTENDTAKTHFEGAQRAVREFEDDIQTVTIAMDGSDVTEIINQSYRMNMYLPMVPLEELRFLRLAAFPDDEQGRRILRFRRKFVMVKRLRVYVIYVTWSSRNLFFRPIKMNIEPMRDLRKMTPVLPT
jgi:hypothetical protein